VSLHHYANFKILYTEYFKAQFQTTKPLGLLGITSSLSTKYMKS